MNKNNREQKKFKGNRMHLDMLLYALKKHDISFWNNWRENNNSEKILLTGANLSNAALSQANFENAGLQEVNLCGSELSDVNLSGADLKNADLSESNLKNANLIKTVLNGTYLYKADLSRAQCIKAAFTDVNLGKANLNGTDLNAVKIFSSDLSDSDLRNCSLENALLDNVTFTASSIYSWNIKNCKVKRLQCEYIYIDSNRKERLPKNRSFRGGEFDWYIKKLKPIKEMKKTNIPEGRALNHVLISSAVEDHEYVESLANSLEIEGIKVWLDKERLQPGIHWQKAVKRAIDNGAYLIICFSKNYLKKINASVFEELQIALERIQQKPDDIKWFIPVKLLRCDIPTKKIGAKSALTDFPWIDFTSGWNEGVKKVIQAIKG